MNAQTVVDYYAWNPPNPACDVLAAAVNISGIQHQQFGSPNRIVNFSSIILDAIKKGEITPNNGMTLYTLTAGGDSLYGSGCFFSVEQPDGQYKYAYYPKFLKGLEEKYKQSPD